MATADAAKVDELPSVEKQTGTSLECPKEYDSLQEVLSQIPKKAQKGLLGVTCDLTLECIDASEDYLAFGSNVGVIFLYDRKKKALERLKTESNNDVITALSLHYGIDHQVAAGTSKGILYLFQLPSILPGKNKQLQQFVVKDLHKASITCLSWSLNGIKLYSGDKKGSVICTETDFCQKECASSPVLTESHSEIVQLHHAHKALLVSTRHRTIVCRTDHASPSHIIQVGKKDRKILGSFGAYFIPGLCKAEDAQLYAARPGLRIWKASINGSVVNTSLFKERLSQNQKEISIMAFRGEARSHRKTSEPQFGIVILYLDKYVVTYSDTHLFILNPEATSESENVIGVQGRLGTIVQVAVCKDEIFILRKNTDRNIVRLAMKPEVKAESLYQKLLKERELAALANKLETSDHMESEPQEEIKHDKKSAKSPLRFLQANVIDKIKALDKPTFPKSSNPVSHLISSIDKFVHTESDHELDADEEVEISHGATSSHQSADSQQPYSSNKDTSPSKDLPPIVKVPSADLLTIEVFTGIPPTDADIMSEEDNWDTINVTAGGQRINPFLKDKDFIDDLQPSGCNEDLDLENKSKHVSDSDKFEDINKAKPESEQEEAVAKPTFVIEKLDQALSQPVQDSSIVFTPKKKKKKKGQKIDEPSSPSLKHKAMKDKEEDNVSTVSEDSRTQEQEQKTDTPRSSDEDDCPSKSGKKKTFQSKKDDNVTYFYDEPENIQTFSALTSRLDSFEKTLTDLPTSSGTIGNSNRTDVKREVNEPDAGAVSFNKEVLHTHSNEDNVDRTFENKTEPEESEKTESSEINEQVHFSLDSVNSGADELTCVTEDKDINKARTEVPPVNLVLESQNATALSKKDIQDDSEEEDSIYSTKKPKNALENLQKAGESLFSRPEGSLHYQSADNTGDDIYTKYGSLESTPSPRSDTLRSLSSEKKDRDGEEEEGDSFEVSEPSPEIPSNKTLNNWTETYTSGNLISMALSKSHVWIVDKSGNIQYSSLRGAEFKWQKVTERETARQLSVSPSGYIVWRLYRETVYAGTKITPRRPEGLKWVEAVRSVQYIAVDDNCAWYIKTNGDVFIQKALSKERPCYRSEKISCPFTLKQIVCQGGVVWGVTEDCKLIYREGISKTYPEGKNWKPLQKDGDELLFSCVTLGDANTGWAIDVLGGIWFTTNVTMEMPMGGECWWQVPVSQMLVQDVTALDNLRSLAKKFDPQKLAYIMSTQRGGIIVAGSGGVWVCPEYKNMLQICRGSVEGHNWKEVHMAGIAHSIAWKLLSASAVDYDKGLVWCCQPNGEMFTYLPRSGNCKSLERPSQKQQLKCLSVCSDSVWCLTESGQVFIRAGMGPHCPQGAEWVDLDLAQLGDVHLISLSCGTQNVWAVDSESTVYQRIGVKAPSTHSLIQAWLPVDAGPSGTTFTQIVSGPKDWMVWAIDNRRQVYTRTDITDNMPIGTGWVHVPGTQAMQLTIGGNYVWALNTYGEILCRYGTTRDNPGGDYWRKIPGVFAQISASSSDQLWAISREGNIYVRKTKYLIRRQPSSGPLLQNTSTSSDEGWELV